jgi:anti-sigma-K factor RskA
MSMLSHDDAKDMLPELALGMLAADDASRVMDVVRTSPALQQELAELRGAASALGSAAGAAPLSASRRQNLRDRLVTRAAASVVADATGTVDTDTPVSSVAIPDTPAPSLRVERGGLAAPADATSTTRATRAPLSNAPAPKQSNPWTLVPWLWVAASAAFTLVQFQQIGVLQRERDAAQKAMKTATAAQIRLTGELASRDSLVASLTGIQVSVFEMASTTSVGRGARMFWDRETNRWTMITHHMMPVPKGRTYQLWLVTAAAQKISAGTFNTDAAGRAIVTATYPLNPADLAAIAVTEEPEGGSPQPTGDILIAASGTK